MPTRAFIFLAIQNFLKKFAYNKQSRGSKMIEAALARRRSMTKSYSDIEIPLASSTKVIDNLPAKERNALAIDMKKIN